MNGRMYQDFKHSEATVLAYRPAVVAAEGCRPGGRTSRARVSYVEGNEYEDAPLKWRAGEEWLAEHLAQCTAYMQVTLCKQFKLRYLVGQSLLVGAGLGLFLDLSGGECADVPGGIRLLRYRGEELTAAAMAGSQSQYLLARADGTGVKADPAVHVAARANDDLSCSAEEQNSTCNPRLELQTSRHFRAGHVYELTWSYGPGYWVPRRIMHCQVSAAVVRIYHQLNAEAIQVIEVQAGGGNSDRWRRYHARVCQGVARREPALHVYKLRSRLGGPEEEGASAQGSALPEGRRSKRLLPGSVPPIPGKARGRVSRRAGLWARRRKESKKGSIS
jgi:hypothetical protein